LTNIERLIYTYKLASHCCKTGRSGLVAQLVEQRTENPRVGGSIPSQATIFIEEKDIKFDVLFFFAQRKNVKCK
jgi:hypothetical protein